MTDEQLLELIHVNPSKGFDKLITEYSALVFRISKATLVPLGTKEDAEECASDVFVNFYRGIDRIDLSKGTIKGYLAVSAKRQAISLLRKLKKENFDSIDEENMTEIADKNNFALKHEQSAEVTEAIQRLGNPDSEIIIRRFFFGETFDEIGKRLAMKPSAVQKRSKRAESRLKRFLGGIVHE